MKNFTIIHYYRRKPILVPRCSLPKNSIKNQIRKRFPIYGSKSNIPSGSTSPWFKKKMIPSSPLTYATWIHLQLALTAEIGSPDDTLKARKIRPSPVCPPPSLALPREPIANAPIEIATQGKKEGEAQWGDNPCQAPAPITAQNPPVTPSSCVPPPLFFIFPCVFLSSLFLGFLRSTWTRDTWPRSPF